MAEAWVIRHLPIVGDSVCCPNPNCKFNISPSNYRSIDPANYCPECGTKIEQDYRFQRELLKHLEPVPCFYQKGCGYEYKD